SYYEQLLDYVGEKYEGVFWLALPREVSRFYRDSLPVNSRNSRRKICMVAHTGYESDNRVRRYAEALVKRDDQVDVIALAEGNAHVGADQINGVNLYRIQHRNHNERHKWTYLWRLLRFSCSANLFLTRRHDRVRYDLIHVHNVPDFLVFTAWFPK